MNENSEINKIKLEWLGHSCFRIEVANESFYFDPVRKNVVLGTTLEPLKEKKASVIFVSHEHWDHFNAETILALCSPQTKIYCPMDVAGPLSYGMTFEGDSPEELQKLTGQITPVQKEDIIEINVKGTGFLRHMVRIIVGTLVEVGYGKLTVDEVQITFLCRMPGSTPIGN